MEQKKQFTLISNSASNEACGLTWKIRFFLFHNFLDQIKFVPRFLRATRMYTSQCKKCKKFVVNRLMKDLSYHPFISFGPEGLSCQNLWDIAKIFLDSSSLYLFLLYIKSEISYFSLLRRCLSKLRFLYQSSSFAFCNWSDQLDQVKCKYAWHKNPVTHLGIWFEY